MTDKRLPLAQGDVIFVPIEAVPAAALRTPQAAEATDAGTAFIVAHSETGHHHVVLDRPSVKMFSGMDQFRAFLEIEEKPADVQHLRDHHTHETISLAPGAWEIRRQRTPSPEGWSRAVD